MYQPYGIPFIALRFQLSPINMPHQKGGNRLDKAHTNFIWRFLDIIGQIVAASILWAVCCLPIITIGPSSTALYYAVVKSVRRDSGEPVWTAFFHSFKENFWQGMYLNLIFLGYCGMACTVLLLSLPADWPDMHNASAGAFIGIGLFLMAAWMIPYAYPLLSRFYFKNTQILRLALYISVRYFYVTFLLVLLLATAVIFSYLYPVFIIAIPALYCFIASWLLEPIFSRYTARE